MCACVPVCVCVCVCVCVSSALRWIQGSGLLKIWATKDWYSILLTQMTKEDEWRTQSPLCTHQVLAPWPTVDPKLHGCSSSIAGLLWVLNLQMQSTSDGKQNRQPVVWWIHRCKTHGYWRPTVVKSANVLPFSLCLSSFPYSTVLPKFTGENFSVNSPLDLRTLNGLW